MRVYRTILTRYLRPTNTKGARVKAQVIGPAEISSFTIPWDHTCDALQNHECAAMQLLIRNAWPGTLTMGEMPKGYVFLATEKTRESQ